MGVKLGAGNISKLYLGANEVSRAYLGNTLVYDAAPAPAYDADWQAVIDFATAQGFTLHAEGVLQAINDWVLREKTALRWAKYDEAVIFFGNGDMDMKCINLLDPTLASMFTRQNSPINSNLNIAGDNTSASITGGKSWVFAGSNQKNNNAHLAIYSDFLQPGFVINQNDGNTSISVLGMDAATNRFHSFGTASPTVDLTGYPDVVIYNKKTTGSFESFVDGTKTTHTAADANQTIQKVYLFGRGSVGLYSNATIGALTRGSSFDDAMAAGWKSSIEILRADVITALGI